VNKCIRGETLENGILTMARLVLSVFLVILLSIGFFYMPCSLILVIPLWISLGIWICVEVIIARVKHTGGLSFLFFLLFCHCLTLSLLCLFAPKGGLSKLINTSHWSGLDLARVCQDIERQTDVRMMAWGPVSESSLEMKLDWDGKKIPLAQCLQKLSSQSEIDFIPRTMGFPAPMSLSGDYSDIDITVRQKHSLMKVGDIYSPLLDRSKN
jgi:hypothetical protein